MFDPEDELDYYDRPEIPPDDGPTYTDRPAPTGGDPIVTERMSVKISPDMIVGFFAGALLMIIFFSIVS